MPIKKKKQSSKKSNEKQGDFSSGFRKWQYLTPSIVEQLFDFITGQYLPKNLEELKVDARDRRSASRITLHVLYEAETPIARGYYQQWYREKVFTDEKGAFSWTDKDPDLLSGRFRDAKNKLLKFFKSEQAYAFNYVMEITSANSKYCLILTPLKSTSLFKKIFRIEKVILSPDNLHKIESEITCKKEVQLSKKSSPSKRKLWEWLANYKTSQLESTKLLDLSSISMFWPSGVPFENSFLFNECFIDRTIQTGAIENRLPFFDTVINQETLKDLVALNSYTLILGEPKSGKTTALKSLYQQSLSQKKCMPIFIDTSKTANLICHREEQLSDCSVNELLFHGIDMPDANYLSSLHKIASKDKSFEIVLFLDDLDLLGIWTSKIIEMIVTHFENVANLHIFATSRLTEKLSVGYERFAICKLLPMTSEQVHSFADNFFEKVFKGVQNTSEKYNYVFKLALANYPHPEELSNYPKRLIQLLGYIISMDDPEDIFHEYSNYFEAIIESDLLKETASNKRQQCLGLLTEWRPRTTHQSFKALSKIAYTVFNFKSINKNLPFEYFYKQLPTNWGANRQAFVNWLRQTVQMVDIINNELYFHQTSFLEFITASNIVANRDEKSLKRLFRIEGSDEYWWGVLKHVIVNLLEKDEELACDILEQLQNSDEGYCFVSLLLSGGIDTEICAIDKSWLKKLIPFLHNLKGFKFTRKIIQHWNTCFNEEVLTQIQVLINDEAQKDIPHWIWANIWKCHLSLKPISIYKDYSIFSEASKSIYQLLETAFNICNLDEDSSALKKVKMSSNSIMNKHWMLMARLICDNDISKREEILKNFYSCLTSKKLSATFKDTINLVLPSGILPIRPLS